MHVYNTSTVFFSLKNTGKYNPYINIHINSMCGNLYLTKISLRMESSIQLEKKMVKRKKNATIKTSIFSHLHVDMHVNSQPHCGCRERHTHNNITQRTMTVCYSNCRSLDHRTRDFCDTIMLADVNPACLFTSQDRNQLDNHPACLLIPAETKKYPG